SWSEASLVDGPTSSWIARKACSGCAVCGSRAQSRPKRDWHSRTWRATLARTTSTCPADPPASRSAVAVDPLDLQSRTLIRPWKDDVHRPVSRANRFHLHHAIVIGLLATQRTRARLDVM